MESNEQTPPARLPEVLIIPMNTHLPSPQEKTPPKMPPAELPVSPSASPKPPASPSQNSVSPSCTLPKTQQPLSIASPQLLEELAQSQARRRPQESSPERPVSLAASPAASPTSPTSPPATPVASPVTFSPTQDRGLSLSSPELLSELKQSRPLRHVKPHSSLTTIFSGRGRVARGPAHGSDSAGQLGPHLPPNTRANGRREEAGSGQVANGTQR
ncbi:proline-rich protein 36-like isoform X3 [Megalops cyprinoides]|uniref:proline-rich protein 36-like isoform X3 n=1 Tax=Megalops cyprinoides TaxID=118141 RepID=UPI0018640D62|nr:proline-rich protein 36-like isoform X3 [Megalops cyprinoides]